VLDSAEAKVSVSLGDGSRIDLDPHSRIVVDVASARQVRLQVAHGTARFDVVHVPDRTFDVIAGGVRVRVVGTRFSVTEAKIEGGERVTVAVERGVVEAEVDPSETPTRIHAGETWSTIRPLVRATSTASTNPAPSAQPSTPVAPPADSAPSAPADSAAPSPAPEPPNASEGASAHAGSTSSARSSAANGASSGEDPSAPELFERANARRQAGDPRGAATSYEALLRRYPNDARAGLAAFELGRIDMDVLGDVNGAIRALHRAVSLAPGSSFREDALARLVQAYGTMGDPSRCERAQKTYLESYPNGVHVGAVQKACGGAH
jgi:TolA-binding protein